MTAGSPAVTPLARASWGEFLLARIDRNWRPSEFDFETLTWIPDPSYHGTKLKLCPKAGCGIRLERGDLCPMCRSAWKATRSPGASLDDWLRVPKVRVREKFQYNCSVPDCARSHDSFGLCVNHRYHFLRARELFPTDPDRSVAQWIDEFQPSPFAPKEKCVVDGCDQDRQSLSGLCGTHMQAYDGYVKRVAPRDPLAARAWTTEVLEPPLSRDPVVTHGAMAATPFRLLPEPLRWEFLYAVQQRDRSGRALLIPFDLRSTYRALRESGVSTAVGLIDLDRTSSNSNLQGMVSEWQRHIDEAYREWSGVDDRDPRIIFLKDLALRQSSKAPVGHKARVDLRGIRNDWLAESVIAWIRAEPRLPYEMSRVAAAWTLADEVLLARGTPKNALGLADMDAIVGAIRDRWRHSNSQKRQIGWIARVIQFSRSDESTEDLWADVPGSFAIDTIRHQPAGDKGRKVSDGEAFRYVPAPIIDWIMGHLDLFERSTSYKTAEARVMIFLQERLGRRTGETVRLKNDCIEYDSMGNPYVSWTSCKPPYQPGKRLPIHQETHDVIRSWQEFKQTRNVASEWLFPSTAHSIADRPYTTGHLGNLVNEFTQFVSTTYPFEADVENAEGNLIHFDVTSIDPYSFRHAFAQRLADATDENGQSTTQPDVLQDYMGHKNFNTTMAYYQVTAKRRRRALESIPPRRLNNLGRVVQVDRERDSYTRLPVVCGHCTEPHNVVTGGLACVLDHACESCPFFLVDPLERDGMEAKRHHLKVRLERARIIGAASHLLDHYEARIRDCTRIIDAIDRYIETLPDAERERAQAAIEQMADIRRYAAVTRSIDLRLLVPTLGADA